MLDLADQRTIPTHPPEPTGEWELPNGRKAALGLGDPTPAPGPTTRAVRVVGAHLSVTYERLPSPTLLVRTGQTPRQHIYRAAAVAGDALGPPLAEGLRSAIGQDAPRATSPLGYSAASWCAHEPIWLTIDGRT